MTRYFSILLLTVLSILTSCCQDKSYNETIILISYDEFTTYKVNQVGGNTDDIDISYDESFEIYDDFSDYFPHHKTFYYDGIINIEKNDKILLWDYDQKTLIDSLPFSYSKLQIYSITNNSDLYIKINSKVLSLASGETKIDTVIWTKTEDNKLKKFTTIVRVEYIDIIKKSNIIDNKDSENRDIKKILDTLYIVERMPEFKGGEPELMKYLTKNIKYPIYDSLKIINTRLEIEFIVNENGDIIKPRIRKSINPDFDKHIIEIIESMPKWKPGEHKGEKRPVKMVLPITIEPK